MKTIKKRKVCTFILTRTHYKLKVTASLSADSDSVPFSAQLAFKKIKMFYKSTRYSICFTRHTTSLSVSASGQNILI